MTHAQNGPILKSSRRRARSLHFRPVRCLSLPCRTPLTTECMMILPAMTPPHFQKKPPRPAPIEGSAGTFGNPVHEATLCLEFCQISNPSICFIKADPYVIYLYSSAILCFILSLGYSRDNSCRMLRNHHIQDKLPQRLRHDSTIRKTLSSGKYDVDVIEKKSPADPGATLSRSSTKENFM
jgi:hypothetical protein